MTREEAIDIETIDEAINNINKIYDDFESEKTCNECIYKPEVNENYPEECGTCSRFYTDKFEEK